MRPTLTSLATTLGGLAVGLLCGCPGTLDHPERFDDVAGEVEIVTAPIDGCGSVDTDLIAQRCTGDCHSGQGVTGALDLRSPNLFERIANQRASGGGILLVPGDPKASVLFQKLTASPPYGSRMPMGDPLDDGSIECVRRWIEVNR